jgi:hypothetical protein
MENTSGQGPNAAVPPEIDRWNWGAFLLNWIWGIGNNTFIALLMFIPLANIVMPFVLGAKGSAWAWRNKRWESIEEFKAVQRSWAKWGIIVLLAFVALIAVAVFAAVTAIKSSDAYRLAATTVLQNQIVVRELGSPLSTGFPSGSIEVSGPSGKADISFSVEGPKGSGTVYVDAVKDLGKWKFNRIELEVDKTGKRIDLKNDADISPTADTHRGST